MASIEKRGEFTYRIIVSAGYDSNGTKIRKKKSIELDPKLTPKQIEKELQRQASLFEEEVNRGTYLDGGKITFSNFCEKWLSDYAEKELEPKTVFRYKEMLNTRIIPAIGHIKLEKLQPPHLIDFYSNLTEEGMRLDTKYIATPELLIVFEKRLMNINRLEKASGISDRTISNALKGLPITSKSAEGISKALDVKLSTIFEQHGDPKPLSSRTILHHHRLISSILTSAVQWQIILNNPANRVKAPKTSKSIIHHYDEEQTKALLKALDLEGLMYKVMVVLGVFSGLRLGELMGLSWGNINFENNTIQVLKASQYLSGVGTFEKNPKNERSIRTISIPLPVITLLREYRKWWLEQKISCGDIWQKSEKLFVTWDGKPMFTYTLTNWFPEFLTRHNLPKITPHGLRHTMASLLDSQGLEISAISKRLGHARISTTSDIYTHVFQKADAAASNLLQKSLMGADNEDEEKQG